MVRKIKTCVFISGKGSNLKSIIKSSRDDKFPIKIELIISNNTKSNGFNIGKKNNIPYLCFSNKSQKKFERNALISMRERKIKFLCLAGFMKILSRNFIKTFGHKIINIHPSLLPKFKGLNTHKRVLKSKDKYAGCSVHFVTPNVDGGKVILQKKVFIEKNETEKSLKNKILSQEHKLYSQSIRLLFN